MHRTLLILPALVFSLSALPHASAQTAPADHAELVASPSAVDAATEDEAPPRDRNRGRNIALMAAGYGVFGLGWALDLIIGPFGGYQDRTCINLGYLGGCRGLAPGTSFQPEWDNFRAFSLIPIAGPWMQLAAKPASYDDFWVPFLVVDGILQGAGLIVAVVGTVLLIQDEQVEAPSVAVLPTFSSDGAGLEVAGRF